MKVLLSVLLVANVLLYGWFHGWLGPWGGDGREPGRLDRQVQADRVTVLGPASAQPGAGSSEGPATAPPTGAGATATTAPPSPPGATAAATAAAPGAPDPGSVPPADPAAIVALLRGATCAEIGPMSEVDAVRVQVALDAVVPDLLVQTRRTDEVTSWWVYLPPMAGIDPQARAAEVRARGVKETYVMPDGAWRGAISLGLFRQEDLAVSLQRSIADRGVPNVRVAPRGPGPGRVMLQVRPVPAEVAAELARLRAVMPEAVARPCPPRG
jgi:hypothetical protein